MPFSGFGRMPRRRVRMKSALSADRGGMDKQAFRCKNPLSPADAAAAPTKMSRHGRNQNHAFNAWHTLALKGHMTGAPLKRHRMGLPIAFLFRPLLKLHKKQDRRDSVGPVCIFVYFCLAASASSTSRRERLIRPWLSISVTLTSTSSPTVTTSSTFSTRLVSSLEM